MPQDKKIILLQGAGINIDRGAEELIDAMPFVHNAVLYVIGSGDVWDILKEKVETRELQSKVVLINKIPKQELMHYTYNADIGLSIDKNSNLNYYYSLPNKIFDYLQAELPILTSHLPEIEKIITEYEVGDFIENHEANSIAGKLNEMLISSKLLVYKLNTRKAKQALNWKTEKQKLIAVINSAKQ